MWLQGFCTAPRKKCERVNLKASQLLRSRRESIKEMRERESGGFIISVQCFLSQFHHPVWRGILFPHSPWVSERPHTNCACQRAQSTPHTHTHTCTHSYGCRERSQHLHTLSLHHLSLSSVLAVSLFSKRRVVLLSPQLLTSSSLCFYFTWTGFLFCKGTSKHKLSSANTVLFQCKNIWW